MIVTEFNAKMRLWTYFTSIVNDQNTIIKIILNTDYP